MQNPSISIPSAPLANATWWAVPNTDPTTPNQYFDFACDCTIDRVTGPNWLALTTEGFYKLWVNGQMISFGPPREAAPYLYYDSFDLTPYLKAGLNRIRIREHYQGVRTQCSDITTPGLLLAGRLGDIDLATPTLWRCHRNQAFSADAPRLHFCVGFAENCDLSNLNSNWLTAPMDSASGCVPELAPRRTNRPQLLPRDLPPFTGQFFTAQKHSTTDGFAIWDFGEEVFGFLSIRFHSPSRVSIELLHGESLEANGIPDFRFAGGDFREILSLPAGDSEWTSFDKRALRFLAVPSSVVAVAVSVQEWSYPLSAIWQKRASAFPSTDKQLLAAAARTLQINCDDLTTDCPRRERAQYNDTTIYMDAFPALFGTWEPMKRWFRQYLRGARPDGTLRMCYPSPGDQTIIPDFSIGFPWRLHKYAEASNDWETPAHCWHSAVGSLESFTRYEDSSGLLTDLPGWLFLCNSPELNKWPHSAALNALYTVGWQSLALMAEKLGKPDATRYHEKYTALRQTWRNAFLTPTGIREATGSDIWEKYTVWNYHHSAATGVFSQVKPAKSSAILRCRIRPQTSLPASLIIAASDKVRVWANGQLLLDSRHPNCWTKTPVFHPWKLPLPFTASELDLVIAFDWNGYEWETYLGMDAPCELIEAHVGESAAETTIEDCLVLARTPVSLPIWTPARHSQITTGYAVACGMLEPAEAVPLLRSCLPAAYHVPWMKRTTPLHCTPTHDPLLLKNRVTPCNTPQSFSLFCEALRTHGMLSEAQSLIRQVYSPQLSQGPGTLWEEFAPRSSLCHAWSSFIAPYLLAQG